MAEELIMNDAALYVEDNKLVVLYGPEEKSAAMEFKNEEERELVKTLLGDVNFWANFLTSLSAAITKHK